MHRSRAAAFGIVCAGVLASACGGSAKPSSANGAGTTTDPSTVASPPSTYAWQNPRIHVSVELSAPHIVSGERIPATLVIRNDSGAPIVSNGCLMDGESVLGEIGLLPFPPPTEPPPPTTTTVAPKASATSILPHPGGPCMGPLHVVAKVGTTRVPFMLEATESLCQLAPASQIRVDVCFPNGKPLRPGTYYVDWVWYGPLPTPTITVPVVGTKP